MAIRICIDCEKEKEPRQFWVRWSSDLGYCYGCLAKKFRNYEAQKILENVDLSNLKNK